MAFDSAEHGGRNRGDVVVRWRRERMEDWLTAGRERIGPVEKQAVKVRSDIEGRVEALNHRDSAGLDLAADTESTYPPPQQRRDRGDEFAEHQGRQSRVDRQPRALVGMRLVQGLAVRVGHLEDRFRRVVHTHVGVGRHAAHVLEQGHGVPAEGQRRPVLISRRSAVV